MRPLLKSRRREKFRKWPWAVSGRRKLGPALDLIEGDGRDLPGVLACRTDAACEHEIELLRLADFVIGIGVAKVVFSA
jgi:hypothetical protein